MEKRRLWEQETENVRMEPNADGKRFVCRGSRAGKLLGLAVLAASMLPLAPVYAVAPDAAVSDDQTDNAQAAAGDYSQVASDSEKVTPQEVGIPGMTPITADDVADGTYEVTVESSSSMFRIEKAEAIFSQIGFTRLGPAPLHPVFGNDPFDGLCPTGFCSRYDLEQGV